MQTKQELIEGFGLKEEDYIEMSNTKIHIRDPLQVYVQMSTLHKRKLAWLVAFDEGGEFPYITSEGNFRKISRKPRTVPWSFEDIKKNADKWYYRGDSNSSHRIIELEFDLEEVGIGQESYLLDDFLDAFVLHDLATGDKQELKKEVTDV